MSIEPVQAVSPEEYERMCADLLLSPNSIGQDEFDELATAYLNDGAQLNECYKLAYDQLMNRKNEAR